MAAATVRSSEMKITQDQMNFIESLRNEREGATALILSGLSHRGLVNLEDVSMGDASVLIKALKTLSRKSSSSSTNSVQPIEDGIYKRGSTVYKVVTSPNSGRKYAKKALISHDGERYRLSWDIAPGMVRSLNLSEKITPEDAKAFGSIYEICIKCGRLLTNEDSIERKIGPVCFAKLFGA